MNLNIGMTRGKPPVVSSGVFKSIVGQGEARKMLDFFIDSHQESTPFPTLLLTGGHGLGKTYFSSKCSKALQRQFLEINCRSCETVDEFFELVVAKVFEPNRPTTILMDEAHDLSRAVTTMFLSLLNPTSKHVNHYTYNSMVFDWDLTLINVIFATTDAYKIKKPLRNRCQEVYFYPYSDNELYDIVSGYLPDINLMCSRKDLALACRGRARDAYILSQNIMRKVGVSGSKDFTQADLLSLKEQLGLLPMGLKRAEVELLKVVREHGPISSSNLAIQLMVNQRNIEEELEIRLRELGFMENTPRGRVVSQKGKSYLDGIYS